MADLTDISRFIALILRHKPQTIGITLDEHGWASTDELIAGVGKKYPFNQEMLEIIVANDEKQRYSFNENHTRIRANQGHSIPVDVELETAVPPKVLYHGTAKKSVASIDRQGLLPKARLYVHLSADPKTALAVGKRHGEPAVYAVDAEAMVRDGCVFYRSANGVWLTKYVATAYLRKIQ